ncbi:thermonuclease family protein [Mycoplasmopsis meleagridis]|uniref:thermonuclease family protein n=1 Tax=Mycoplasmopsis meleagridis TaxID=29561 RepID=UPI00073DACA6|nr:thermonuclease family protein [Mycoplasmopsis meleagridis]KUH47453.1 hypothetical protein ASB56_01125 [Mycoplasmopsis meleagridis]
MKRSLWLISLISLLFLTSSCNNNFDKPFYKIVSNEIWDIHDGDTFKVTKNKQNYTIRLFGIDTPEINFVKNKIRTNYAIKARTFTENFLKNSPIELTYLKKDFYGRYVCLVKNSKNEDLAYKIALNGFGIVRYADDENYKNPFYIANEELKIYIQKLMAAEKIAKKNKIGIWANEKLYTKIYS